MRILVVDDNRTNRALLSQYLTDQGHEPLVAFDGLDAVQKFETDRPDIVLMDVVMPGMDGFIATQLIKSKCQDSFIPVIFLTSLEGSDVISKCIESGGDDFLPKSYDKEALLAKITSMGRIKQLHERHRHQCRELEFHAKKDRREWQIAEHVFSSVTSKGDHKLPCIKYRIEPMSLFSGDIFLCAQTPAGGLHAMLGDFTGHGLSAAIGAIPVSDVFYTMTEKGFSIGDIAAELNSRLYGTLPTGMFCAAILVDMSADRSTLTVWNGGMPDVLVTDASGNVAQRVASSHLAIGVRSTHLFDRKMDFVPINESSKVYLYSDGLIEARNEHGEKFGMARLLALIPSVAKDDQPMQRLFESIDKFRNGEEQRDDISVVEVSAAKYERWTADNKRLKRNLLTPSRWGLSLKLDADTLKVVNPVPLLLNLIMGVQAPEGHREHIFTILSELFNNSLDHGLLRLDSSMKSNAAGFAEFYSQREQRLAKLKDAEIVVRLNHQPLEDSGGGRLKIVVQDSGAGFDHSNISAKPEGNQALSGRGIPLIRSLCQSLEYHGRGNKAEAIYQWTR